MTRYIIRRFLQAIPTLLGISLLGFTLIKVAPGDYVLMSTFDPSITAEARDEFRRQLGHDQPIPIQYVEWLTGVSLRGGNMVDNMAPMSKSCRYFGSLNFTFCDRGGGLLRWDLGYSLATKEPVWDMLRSRMPATFELGIVVLILSFLFGVPLGFLGALFRGSVTDQVVRLLSVAGQAVPVFWMGIMCIFIFSVLLGWLPVSGRMTISLDMKFSLVDRIRHLILPSFVLSLGPVAFLTKLVRTQVLEVIEQDFVRTARAKGLGSLALWTRHVQRNAMLPLATVLGPAIVGVINGALVVETIFAWPGMGRLTWFSALQRDYPMIMGAVMFFSPLTILSYLISDILYAVVDPRIRLR
ncbi:MAG: ABC transporter permease [Caldilineaceae bacterium SB0665_bin_21]|nr:ABC transporter permease [Caldilineaceae bacterium SB0665_bin_21]MYA04230.1 ABC transporter permease [Caldilineaceae bacterium SB0664_bin_22]MYC61745.1 ABC transporter permease [Caldilineaceae bacterium SB0661_bin_34]